MGSQPENVADSLLRVYFLQMNPTRKKENAIVVLLLEGQLDLIKI